MTLLSCEHAIYTSAVTDELTGYQFVARSAGISNDDLKVIQSYTTFIRTLPINAQFSRSVRYYPLGPHRRCVTILMNAGPDSAGRPNRIFSHTFILNVQHLRMIGFDPFRIDTQAITINDKLRGIIPPVNLPISPSSLYLDPITDMMDPTDLRMFLYSFYSGNRIILEVEGDRDMSDLMKSLISVLPERERQSLSFSTYSMGIAQRGFTITIVPREIKVHENYPPDEAPMLIDLVNHRTQTIGDTDTSDFINFLVPTIIDKDAETVSGFLESINTAPDTVFTNLERWTGYWKQYKKFSLSPLPLHEKGDKYYELGKQIMDLHEAEAIKNMKIAFDLFHETDNPMRLKDTCLTIVKYCLKQGDMAGGTEYFINACSILWERKHLAALYDLLNVCLGNTPLVHPFLEYSTRNLLLIDKRLLTGNLSHDYLKIIDLVVTYLQRTEEKDYLRAALDVVMKICETFDVDRETRKQFLSHAEEILPNFDAKFRHPYYVKLKIIHEQAGAIKDYYRLLWRLATLEFQQRRILELAVLTEVVSSLDEQDINMEAMGLVRWLVEEQKTRGEEANKDTLAHTSPFYRKLFTKSLTPPDRNMLTEEMMRQIDIHMHLFHEEAVRKELLPTITVLSMYTPRTSRKGQMGEEERLHNLRMHKWRRKSMKAIENAYVQLIKEDMKKHPKRAKDLVQEARSFFVNASAHGHTPHRIISLELKIHDMVVL